MIIIKKKKTKKNCSVELSNILGDFYVSSFKPKTTPHTTKVFLLSLFDVYLSVR